MQDLITSILAGLALFLGVVANSRNADQRERLDAIEERLSENETPPLKDIAILEDVEPEPPKWTGDPPPTPRGRGPGCGVGP